MLNNNSAKYVLSVFSELLFFSWVLKRYTGEKHGWKIACCTTITRHGMAVRPNDKYYVGTYVRIAPTTDSSLIFFFSRVSTQANKAWRESPCCCILNGTVCTTLLPQLHVRMNIYT